MVTAQNILYSVSSARRILGIYYPEITVKIQVWKTVIWVQVAGKRPTFISKSVFKKHFVEWRQQQAKNIAVSRDFYDRDSYQVQNGTKGTVYAVQTLPLELICGCEDYWNQIKFFGKGCCKHGYAVLNYLGCKSLAEYQAAKGQAVAA